MKRSLLIIAIFALVATVAYAYFQSLNQAPVQVSHVVSLPAPLAPTPNPTLSPTMTTWTSSDGSQTLTMKIAPEAGNQKTYTFLVRDPKTGLENVVFSQKVGAETTMSMPFNSWSPDNQHFFVQEITGTNTRSLVFNDAGKKFADGALYEDVNASFVDKKIPYPLMAVTGWAAPTLLVVNTKAPTSDAPISYWFDINRKTFTRLSTSFQ